MNNGDALPSGLTQHAAKPVDPEQLELYGKRAAALYTNHGTRLNDAVVETIKDAALSPEQVKRVCEFANTAAYLAEFEKGGEYRNVTFEGGPADPRFVLQEVYSGAHPTVQRLKTADYRPPEHSSYKETQKIDLDAVLGEAFGKKHASVIDHSARANTLDELYDLKVRLEGMKQDLQAKYASASVELDTVKQEFCEACKQEILGGATVSDLARAWAPFSDAPMMKVAVSTLCSFLKRESVLDHEELVDSLSKTATVGRIPNPKHPAVDRFLALTKAAENHRELEKALDIVGEQLQQVNAAIKERL